MIYRIQNGSTTGTRKITGQYLARNRLGKRARARLVNDIRGGRLEVTNLTVRQAAYLCRVSVPSYTYYAKAIRKPSPAPETLVELFRHSTPEQLLACARAVGPAVVWDKMIAPLV